MEIFTKRVEGLTSEISIQYVLSKMCLILWSGRPICRNSECVALSAFLASDKINKSVPLIRKLQ